MYVLTLLGEFPITLQAKKQKKTSTFQPFQVLRIAKAFSNSNQGERESCRGDRKFVGILEVFKLQELEIQKYSNYRDSNREI